MVDQLMLMVPQGVRLHSRIQYDHGLDTEALKEYKSDGQYRFEPSIIQLIGPPGVSKTAILEGLGSRIVSKEVPESLHDKHVLSIDLAGIMAGSGIRGQFEEKFRGLIQDIEAEKLSVETLIYRVQTLFNLGKTEGSIDGGQMIKQALSRGLQLVGATTPDEYRKTIGKDAALEHRFQAVQIEEPSVESTISILRGLEPRYEVHHGLLSTAHDKAIDLVDEATSSLRLAQESKPDKLEALDRAIMTLQIELESLKKESDTFSVAALSRRRSRASAKRHRKCTHSGRQLKQRLEDAKCQLDVAQREGDFEKASRLWFSTIPELTEQLPDEKAQAGREEDEALWMLHKRVTSNDISRVVAHATGTPVQNLLKRECNKLVHMEEETLRRRVVGHDHAVKAFHDRHTISRLIGAAPGYAGFEEGGSVLIPRYLAVDIESFVAVILLDELEKHTR
ncbi:P-loop containing nucleoside triphosphate hydrolase protein [Mycena olivaceomarginata]|nr:P-loop containing nucleoside triphosphate hydrolase protein [Mycena olivaceomarginata]